MAEQRLLERQNGILAGVSGGIAVRFGWSPFIIRLLFFILLLPVGLPGLVPYLLLWIMMPKRRYLSGQLILLRPLFFQNLVGFHYHIFVPESGHYEAGRPDKKTNYWGLTFVWLSVTTGGASKTVGSGLDLVVFLILGYQSFKRSERAAFTEFNERRLVLAKGAAGGIEQYFETRVEDLRGWGIIVVQHLDEVQRSTKGKKWTKDSHTVT